MQNRSHSISLGMGGVVFTLASASLPLAMLSLPLVAAVPAHFGDALGMNLTLVGTIVMSVRVLDIIVDPILGLLMDSTSTRWGRFRPWLLGGIPFIVAGSLMLFMAQPGVGPLHLMTGLILAYIGWSIISLAQLALGAGLSNGYAARSKIYAWIQAFALLGICLVMLLPMVLGSRANSSTASLEAMGWLIIGVTIVIVALVFAFVPDKLEARARLHLGVSAYISLVLRPAVIRVLAADLLFGLGYGIASAVMFYYFMAYKGIERSGLGVILIAEMGVGMISVPLVARVAAHYGKHVMLAVCGLAGAIVCPTMLLVPHGSLAGAAFDSALWGIVYGGVTFIPRAMMADAADEVRLETSADRTGVLLALLISSWKLGGALSVGIGFIALDFIGYQAKLGAANTPAALNGLQLLFILSPTILSLIAAFFTWGYPLTATRHGEIREALEARDRALVPAEEGPLGPLGGQVAAAE